MGGRFTGNADGKKEQFEACGAHRNEMLTVFEKEAFICGFKLGARMAAEVFSDN